MALSTDDYVRHILEEAAFLRSASANLEKEEYLNDPMRQRAFVRSLEIMGEATKHLPGDFRTQFLKLNGGSSLVCAIS